jgi:hypothetical protein
LPALQPPLVVPAENHSARADSDGFIFGVRTGWTFNMGWSPKDILGDLEFVCGPSGSPALGQTDAVGASATFHSYHGGDRWIDGASICLPVPKGSQYSVKKGDDYLGAGGAISRFQRAETKLTFGQWRIRGDRKDFTGAGSNEFHAPGEVESDGFIFCSVRAPGVGDRGFVSCTVDGKILGAASVHNIPSGDGCWSPHACFCVPVPRLLQMSIEATASYGKLDIKIWYLASTSRDWKFGRPEPYTLDALHTAETDGFLNGVVTVRQGSNARGMLFLHCGPDRANIDRQNVTPAMMAVHQTTNRFIPYASAMLPIRKGFVFRPVPLNLSQDSGHSPATVEAYWTPLVVA